MSEVSTVTKSLTEPYEYRRKPKGGGSHKPKPPKK